jgi:serine/threonine protein kinase
LKTIAHSLGSALRYLEKKNIAHRDIKLANIVINHEGKVKLTDLGFAKLTSE